MHPTPPLDSRARRLSPHIIALSCGAALVAACSVTPSTPLAVQDANLSAARSASPMAAAIPAEAFVGQQLAQLRRAVANFRDTSVARAAGYDATLTGCMSDPALGGMGVHVGDLRRFDSAVTHDAPEILMYEPESNGRLRFVGVEFAVPFAAWTAASPPSLFGQSFHANNAFGLWVLHVWVGRDNPSGIFADWNPKVSCGAS